MAIRLTTVLVVMFGALVLTGVWFFGVGRMTNSRLQEGERVSSLVRLAVVFRHGDRAPLMTYPTDPYPFTDANYWPDGQGQLTIKGKQRMLKLGQMIGKKYGDFLAGNPRGAYVRSAGADRCLASAELVMAGVYPPAGRMLFHPRLNWQPIPIHAENQATDGMFESLKTCDAARRGIDLQSAANETLAYMRKKWHVVQRLEQGSGLNLTSAPYMISGLHNPLAVDRETGKRLPDWATDDLMRELHQMTASVICVANSGQRQQRLTTGLLFHDLESLFKPNESAIIDNVSRNALFYATHDVHLMAVLMAMNASDGQTPIYGSTLMFEMHEIEGQAIVRVFYLKDPMEEGGDVVQLKTRGCPAGGECSVQQFFSGLRPYITDSQTHRKECAIIPLVAQEVDCIL